ncbi:hypothetical protein OsI_22790 [Oryza sativa Indica Group]|uniref:Uncharacterized protein n=4 Tax=Oryza TaxID=4527 RepID=A0A0E0PX87_ORYRU|nr:uncharacterized protein LOC127776021 [Oryza glaberrima]EAZ00764.1 hypothetical protein OsI_22790 [Oryza sativa Indica Group]
MADHRKITSDEEEAAVKPTRSFRYEDYSTRRVFLRSYPLQWDWASPAPGEKEKQQQQQVQGVVAGGDGEEDDDEYGGGGGDERGGRRWRRQVAVAVVEWGEEKLLLLRRVKKRLALYLIGCHYAGHRAALPFKSSSASCTAAMLASSR